MIVSKIVIGEYYRHRENPKYGWAKALRVLRPKEGDNANTYSIVMCEWSVSKGDKFGLIKHFKPSDLVKAV